MMVVHGVVCREMVLVRENAAFVNDLLHLSQMLYIPLAVIAHVKMAANVWLWITEITNVNVLMILGECIAKVRNHQSPVLKTCLHLQFLLRFAVRFSPFDGCERVEW